MVTTIQRLCLLATRPLLLGLLFALASSLFGAESKTPGFECRWAEGAIVIDGKPDESAWAGAQVVSNFTMPWLPKAERPGPSTTRARLLWDREYLYFFAEMSDVDLSASAPKAEKGTWEEDGFEAFLKPAQEQGGYYHFQVNAANVRHYTFLPPRGTVSNTVFLAEGPFGIETAVALKGTLNKRQDKDLGWSVEGRIPWRNFMRTGGRPGLGDKWTFALCRCDYSAGEDSPRLSSTAPFKRLDFHRVEDYAALKFVGPPENPLKPYGMAARSLWTNSHVVGSPAPPFPYQTVRAFPDLKVQLPVAIASEPGSDRLIFLEHTAPWSGYGKVRRFKNEASVSEAETLLESEDILYGITFHPKFSENGYLYLGGNGPWNQGGKKTRIVRYTMSRQAPYAIDPKSKLTIIEWDSDGHNGGDMVFGNDGMLYVTSGDGTSDSDRNIAGQDLTKLTSKVLRIDVEHPSEGRAYSVPTDNPFLKVPGARPETWTYGLRNPWRITIDRESGRLWVGENGQDLWEMARVIERGANYGWSVYEGSHPFNLKRQMGTDPLTPPTVEHPHSEFRSLSGGVVYYGRKLPGLRGAYIYGDWGTGRIWGAKHNGQRLEWDRELVDTPFAITGFGVDADGEILVIDEGTGFYRLEPAPSEVPTNHFPTRLSETGVFTSVKDNKLDPGLIPYSVNSPLWSDGAAKERFIGLPGDTQIDFTFNRAWNFPEGTVLVKTFALELEEGNPASLQRIETRLLTRQQKEWVGYSYLWNEAQTDATLVDSSGADKVFQIKSTKTAGGSRKQTWHYPSRTECMVCHSRAANFVLGLTEQQMNREHTYGSVTDNQLRVLEHLGALKVDWAEYERDAVSKELSAQGVSGEQKEKLLKQMEAAPSQRKPIQVATMLPRVPEKMRKLPEPLDAAQPLQARAKSYLQGNCAHCHVEAGGGNSLMELEFLTPLTGMRVVDVKPQHHTFDLAEARLVAPGHPERSVLLHRISNRDAGHMPPLGTALVDADAVRLLREWIAGMPEAK
jgi:glucose/arabinose dehydrogenase